MGMNEKSRFSLFTVFFFFILFVTCVGIWKSNSLESKNIMLVTGLFSLAMTIKSYWCGEIARKKSENTGNLETDDKEKNDGK